MREPRSSPACAFTTIELLLALAISAIVMSSIPLMISLASRAVPTSGGVQVAAAEAADCFAQLTADLQVAHSVTAMSAGAITMTAPARDGSGVLHTITYAWGGAPGDPVTVEIDGRSRVLIRAADEFSLNPVSGLHTVHAGQTLTERSGIIHQSAIGTPSGLAIPPTGSYIQVLAPPADAGVIGWTTTEIDVWLGCSAAAIGKSVTVSVIPLNADRSPAPGAYYRRTIASTDLSASLTSHRLAIPPLWLPLDRPVGVQFTTTSSGADTFVGGIAASVGYAGGGLYGSTTSVGPWAVRAGWALCHEARGSTLTSVGGAAERACLERLDVRVTTGDGNWVFATSIVPLNRVGTP